MVEFLLINRPLDCRSASGRWCQLQDLAIDYGAGASLISGRKRVVLPTRMSARFVISMEGKCRRYSLRVRPLRPEIAGVMELGLASRNMHSEIETMRRQYRSIPNCRAA